MDFPNHFPDETVLDELLSRPSPDLNKFMSELDGDIMILGAAGKIGISLARMTGRSIQESGVKKKVYAIDLQWEKNTQDTLRNAGVNTIQCDLLNREEISKLPAVTNVIYMAGRKFGTGDDQELTWALNVIAPNNVAHHFVKSRIVVFSTGCVYPLVSPDEGGCTENTPLSAIGEYAQSCVGRERVFSYYSKTHGTKVCQYRLNYAIDMRYGVLYDIGLKVFHSKPVELGVSHLNCIWQGDANRQALLCLDHCKSPPGILNITGPEMVSVKETAEKFARYFNKLVKFTGEELKLKMYLSDASKSIDLFGSPLVTLDKMIEWQARWIEQGGRSLNKPTHFEVTSGKY